MTALTTLQQLAALRRQSEQRALETLAAEAARVQHAEREAEEAALTLQRQMHVARARERALVGSLTGGGPVSPAAIVRVQAELDRAAVDTLRLRAATARAQTSLQERQKARAEAMANFQRRQRATARADLVCGEEIARKSRSDAARDEAENDDRNAAIKTSQEQ